MTAKKAATGPKPILWLLALIPVANALKFMKAEPLLIFVFSALSMIPLAVLLSDATEELAKYLGSLLGSVLNATMGNAAELILTITAIHAGELDIVRASIAGAIISNALLIPGVAAFLGGMKYPIQRFNPATAGMMGSMLMVAMVSLLTPSVFAMATDHPNTPRIDPHEGLTLAVSALMLMLYLGSMLFSLKTHKHVFAEEMSDHEEPPHWTRGKAIGMLVLATCFIAWQSEVLVDALDPTIEKLGWSKLFVGVIIVPILGNAGEGFTAIKMAMRDKMDVAMNVCLGASVQIAFFVAPVLVFLSYLLGHPMPLTFPTFELIAIAFAVLIAEVVAHDGETHWLEGAQLIVLYLILGAAFFFTPAPVEGH